MSERTKNVELAPFMQDITVTVMIRARPDDSSTLDDLNSGQQESERLRGVVRYYDTSEDATLACNRRVRSDHTP